MNQLKPNTYTDPQIHKAVEGKTITLSDAEYELIIDCLLYRGHDDFATKIKEQLNNQ